MFKLFSHLFRLFLIVKKKLSSFFSIYYLSYFFGLYHCTFQTKILLFQNKKGNSFQKFLHFQIVQECFHKYTLFMLLLKVGDQALGNTPKKKDPSFCPMSECNVRYFTSVKFQKPFDSFFALFVALICKSENVCFNLFFEFFLIKEFVKVVDGVSTPHLFQVNVSSSNLFSNKLQIPQLLLILCSKSAMTTLNRVHLSHPLFKLRDQKFILLVFFQF